VVFVPQSDGERTSGRKAHFIFGENTLPAECHGSKVVEKSLKQHAVFSNGRFGLRL
jgi:hypothetical protein